MHFLRIGVKKFGWQFVRNFCRPKFLGINVCQNLQLLLSRLSRMVSHPSRNQKVASDFDNLKFNYKCLSFVKKSDKSSQNNKRTDRKTYLKDGLVPSKNADTHKFMPFTNLGQSEFHKNCLHYNPLLLHSIYRKIELRITVFEKYPKHFVKNLYRLFLDEKREKMRGHFKTAKFWLFSQNKKLSMSTGRKI